MVHFSPWDTQSQVLEVGVQQNWKHFRFEAIFFASLYNKSLLIGSLRFNSWLGWTLWFTGMYSTFLKSHTTNCLKGA